MITEGQFHQRKKSWLEIILTWSVMCILMFAVALLFVKGLEKDEYVQQAKLARHLDGLLYPDSPIKAPTGVRPNYGASSEPRTRVFQDSSVKSEVLEQQSARKRDGIK